MIKGLVFDFDGLIMDTEDCEYQAYLQLFSKYDSYLPLEVWGKCIGTRSSFSPYSYLEKQIGKPLDHTLLRAERETYFSRLVEGLGPRPGVLDYLQKGTEMGLKIGLASSSPRQWIDRFLGKLGLEDYFQCICTADDVEVVKPDPALYQLAVSRLKIRADEAIAFEDSPNGALAAVKAGLYCVAVPNATTKGLSFPECHLRIGSMSEMSLNEVIGYLEQEHQEASNE